MNIRIISYILLVALIAFLRFKLMEMQAFVKANEQLNQENTQLQEAQTHLRDQIALLKDNDTQRISLTDGSAKVNTYIYYNAFRKEAALDLGGISQPPEDQYLQVWTIEKEIPMSLGMVSTTAVGSWQILPFRPDSEGFMISQGKNVAGEERPLIVLMTGKTQR